MILYSNFINFALNEYIATQICNTLISYNQSVILILTLLVHLCVMSSIVYLPCFLHSTTYSRPARFLLSSPTQRALWFWLDCHSQQPCCPCSCPSVASCYPELVPCLGLLCGVVVVWASCSSVNGPTIPHLCLAFHVFLQTFFPFLLAAPLFLVASEPCSRGFRSLGLSALYACSLPRLLSMAPRSCQPMHLVTYCSLAVCPSAALISCQACAVLCCCSSVFGVLAGQCPVPVPLCCASDVSAVGWEGGLLWLASPSPSSGLLLPTFTSIKPWHHFRSSALSALLPQYLRAGASLAGSPLLSAVTFSTASGSNCFVHCCSSELPLGIFWASSDALC